ncbi:MAG: glucosamine-6-phosphate deaminase [Mangrovibacterium sp.]
MTTTPNHIDSKIEKIPVIVFSDKNEGSAFIANEIASTIKANNEKGERTVLGLATGSSPLAIYKELIRIHKDEGLSFKNVVSFNLDEYYSIQPDDKLSYNYFMNENLFKHIDILSENTFIPDGSIDVSDINKYCQDYEQKINSFGGIDIQLLGIGRSGHIGFNEPGSIIGSQTRFVRLDSRTIEDAAKDFGGEANVPHRAITMGVRTILNAKRILLVGWGKSKSPILKQMIEGEVIKDIPASFLQTHDNVTICVDYPATSNFTRSIAPWLVSDVNWTRRMMKRAVTWLSLHVDKPILKLTDDDYKDNGLRDLLTNVGSAYDLNIEIFDDLRHTITGWPGGKPGAYEKTRPERPEPACKRTIIFSPHPDDDVISMGGTMIRLADQGHEVHVAYQTSGNIAVFDDDAIRYSQFLVDMLKSQGIECGTIVEENKKLRESIANKKTGDIDSQYVKTVKGNIRIGEAVAGCRFSGINEDNIHFLNLPFYETGQVEKSPASDKDLQIVIDLLRSIKPHQIFAAGDLQDPHGTHEVCLQIIFKAIRKMRASGQDSWLDDCYMWLYRGAWQEWDVEDIEMAVPISPDEVKRKRKAIFKHQSQKDEPVFPGKDKREFWQRAEDRNKETAIIYDKLGLVEYEAIEAFVRYPFDDEETFLK